MVPATAAAEDPQVIYDAYCAHNSGLRIHTDTVVQAALISQYPSHSLTSTSCDLIAYANAGHAIATLNEDVHPTLRSWVFQPTARQPADGTAAGKLVPVILFGRFDYVWQDHRFHVFVVDGQNNLTSACDDRRCYVLSPPTTAGEKDQVGSEAMEALVLAAGIWSERSHDQVWVYDQGGWSKNKELWQLIQGGSWKDMIFNEGTERSILRDVIGFFDAKETYAELRAPWKVGCSCSRFSSLVLMCVFFFLARIDIPWIARQWQNNDREIAYEGTPCTTHAGPNTCCQDPCATLLGSTNVGSADLCESATNRALSTFV